MRVDIAICIRDDLSDQKIPSWLSDIFGLEDRATFSDIPHDMELDSLAEVRAINHFLQIIFTRRIRDSKLKNKVPFTNSKLVLNDEVLISLGLSKRTLNGIKSLISESGGEVHINKITYGTLHKIPNMGSKSVLEFLFRIEGYSINNVEDISDTNDLLDFELSGEDKNINNEIKKLIEKIETFENIDQIYRGDPRFSVINIMLPIKEYTYGSTLDDLIQQSKKTFDTWSMNDRLRLKTILSETSDILCNLNSMSLDMLFQEFIKKHYKNGKEKHLIALGDRFGINERGTYTLEECGQKIGITRERIRQIESKILKSIGMIPGNQTIYMPKINDALNVIRNNLGSSISYIQNLIFEYKIASIPLSMESILQFSSLLRMPTDDLKIINVRNGEQIIAGDDIEVSFIMMQAGKLYSRNGIADINLIYNGLLEADSSTSYEEIRNVTRGSGRWHALDSEERWWIPANLDDIARNRLINITQKILSVCNPIEVGELRNCYIRVSTFRNSSNNSVYDDSNKIVVPSKMAILEFFKYIDDYTVFEDKISTDQYIDYKTKLGTVEKGIVESLLTSKTGLMSRQELMRTCKDKGLNESSVNTYMSFSPVVQHVGLDTYKIIGKETTASSYSAHQKSVAEKIRTRRLLLCDWENGMIRFVIRCPEFLTTLVVGCPSSVKNILINKKFQALSESDEKQCGTIGVNEDGTIYGMSTFCRVYGVEEDDILVIKIDLLENNAYLSVNSIDDYLDMLD